MQKLIEKILRYIFLLFIGIPNVFSQQNTINLVWSNNLKTVFADTTQSKGALFFENASYRTYFGVPEFVYPLGITDSFMNIHVSLENQVFVDLTSVEISVLEENGYIPQEDIVHRIEHKIIKKEKHTELVLFPFRKDPVTGKFQKLISFSIKTNISFNYDEKKYEPKTLKITQSALADGSFVKISIGQPGIYKITAQQFAQMGFNVSSINPKNIRIYGNGGRMLPEANSIPRINDLFENAIFVHGQDDNSFDASDYILFYAPGPSSWEYNASTKEYSYRINLYNDRSFYFITANKGPGKRIESVNHTSEIPALTTSIFLDRQVYENETYNLIKSGKEWYGDVFDLELQQTFSFSLPSVLADSCIKIRTFMVARGQGATIATMNVGSTSTNFGFSGTTGYTSDFARPGTGVLCVPPTSNLNVVITYNKSGFSDAKAWLNRIIVNGWRNLTMTGNQMHFRNPHIDSLGNFARYNITNTGNLIVWDITNPLEPVVVQGNQAGNTYSIIAPAFHGKEFIAHTGINYLTPAIIGSISNQNLHGLAQADYIIVSPPQFVEQATLLGQFHQNLNGLSFHVVTPQKIYNEFSSGSQDPTAIRDFMKMFYDRATSQEEMPKYLLLFGRASYDYKNRISDNTNFVPTFQSMESLNPTRSYASDDFFGLLDYGEGEDCNGHLDVGIGRFPVRNNQEATEMINKIFRYHEKTNSVSFQNTCNFIQNVPNLSDWRNCITFISDDGDMNLHFSQSEGISTILGNTYKHLNIDKIHLKAYPQHSTPGGDRAPEVNKSINRRMDLGCLIMNYTGHGGEVGWAHERILELSDINSWNNFYNMPLFITATCEFSRFDDPGRISAGEIVLTNPNGGGIALFSTTRLAYSSFNENINRSVFKIAYEHDNGVYPTLGEILSFAKTDNGSNQFIRNFILLGDPAMRLAYPEHRVITTSINGNSVAFQADTISAYSFVTVEGYIADINNIKLDGFNGIITPTVFDKPSTFRTLAADPSDGIPANFNLQKNIIYKGKVSVVNGEFSFSFFVPKNINYSFDFGKISYYAENGQTDATGFFDNFYVGGTADNIIEDNKGPKIKLYMNDTTFVGGGTTSENPVLIALLKDSSGINTMGSGIGHDIISILDNSGNVIVMNDYYIADLNSFKSGRVVYPFYELEEGLHSVYFKAWDVFNNSSEAVLNFYVSLSHNAVIQKMLNYPNPFTEYTYFIFEHNQSCAPIEITIDIFNSFGKHVSRIETLQETLGYSAEPIRWHGLSHNGNPLTSGVYVYTITIKTCEGSVAHRSNKLIIVK